MSRRTRGRARLLRAVRIAVFADGLATRYAARLAAQLGAEVVARRDEPAVPTALDAWLDEDVQLASRDELLRGDFDVVIAGQQRETIDRACTWSARHGRARTCVALRWFAADGPYADWPGSDAAIYALSGVAHSFGEADGPPTIPRGHLPQVLGGLNAMIATLASLCEPPDRRPGHVEVNVLEAMVALVEPPASAGRDGRGAPATRLGVNRFDPSYPTTSYRTADGWVGVSCLTPPQWAGLAALVGRPDLADDERFATSRGRLAHADEIDRLLAPSLAERTTGSIVAEALARRLPICPMPRPGELPVHEHWRHRGSFGGVPAFGELAAPHLPYCIDEGRPTVRRTPGRAGAGPLAGIRVADFTMGWAGPYATRLLADLGADVVKVEHTSHPDWWRGWDGDEQGDPPPVEVQNHFNVMNRAKRDVCLDLRSAEGLAAAERLVTTADVAVDNFAAGVLARRGLGPDVQRRLNPHIVTMSMPAFGTDGPLADLRAYGTTVEQSSGLPFVNGRTEWPPCLHHVALGDPISGMFGGLALLASIVGRSHAGPATIELSQVECLFQTAAAAIIDEQLGGPRPDVVTDRVLPAGAPDRWVLAVEGGHDGRPGFEVPIQRSDELGHDPQHAGTDLWGTLERRYVGVHSHARQPFRLDGTRPPLRAPAPLLGEHTEQVLAEL